jgi:hypothetical protein
LCTAALSCILAEKAKSNVKDRKEAMLKLYDSLLTYAEFAEVDEDDFYELSDKVSLIFIMLLDFCLDFCLRVLVSWVSSLS